MEVPASGSSHLLPSKPHFLAPACHDWVSTCECEQEEAQSFHPEAHTYVQIAFVPSIHYTLGAQICILVPSVITVTRLRAFFSD